MKNSEITKQMINCHKTVFAAGLDAMVMLQEQTTKAVDHYMKQSPWIPGQSKSMISEWNSLYKSGITDFKEAAGQNYAKLEAYLTSGSQTSKPTSKQ